jgi:transcriptional regulator with XRE-family HTH domain
MKEFGRRVKARRLRMGLSQVELATAVGRSHAWLSLVERGLAPASAAHVLALAAQLSEPPEEYLNLAGLAGSGVSPIAAVTLTREQIEDLVGRTVRRTLEELRRDEPEPGEPPSTSPQLGPPLAE